MMIRKLILVGILLNSVLFSHAFLENNAVEPVISYVLGDPETIRKQIEISPYTIDRDVLVKNLPTHTQEELDEFRQQFMKLDRTVCDYLQWLQTIIHEVEKESKAAQTLHELLKGAMCKLFELGVLRQLLELSCLPHETLGDSITESDLTFINWYLSSKQINFQNLLSDLDSQLVLQTYEDELKSGIFQEIDHRLRDYDVYRQYIALENN